MLILIVTAIGVLLSWIRIGGRIVAIIIVVGALVLLLLWTILLLVLWCILLIVRAEGLLVGIVILAIIILLAWLLIRVLLLLLVWLAFRGVVLVIITVLIITVIVLLVAIIVVIVVAGLVVLCILRLEVAVLVVVIGALIIGAIVVVVVLRALLKIASTLLTIGRLKVVFNSACEAFKAFRDVGTTVRARDAAMCIFIIFASPTECFAVAELNSGVGIELEPSAEKARFCALDQFTECGTFGEEVVVVWIRGKIAFKLVGESADLIISEFSRLLAGESFEVVFYQEWVTGTFEECKEVNCSVSALSGRRVRRLWGRGWSRVAWGGRRSGVVFPTDA